MANGPKPHGQQSTQQTVSSQPAQSKTNTEPLVQLSGEIQERDTEPPGSNREVFSHSVQVLWNLLNVRGDTDKEPVARCPYEEPVVRCPYQDRFRDGFVQLLDTLQGSDCVHCSWSRCPSMCRLLSQLSSNTPDSANQGFSMSLNQTCPFRLSPMLGTVYFVHSQFFNLVIRDNSVFGTVVLCCVVSSGYSTVVQNAL